MKITNLPINQFNDFHSGEVLLINKPLNWTSFDVVNKVRYLIKKSLYEKEINSNEELIVDGERTLPAGRRVRTNRTLKVGHAGTLDPLATGLLILCTGKLTKRIGEYQGLEKEYIGKLTLGATTPSYDLETPIDKTFNIDYITEEMIRQTAKKFIGTISQVPPAFSARKINGERAYKKARRGEKVTIKPTEVVITQFDITRISLPEVEFRVVCSKSTYIRSLILDFGEALNNGAYLTALCRTRIGKYKLKDALEIEDLRFKIED